MCVIINMYKMERDNLNKMECKLSLLSFFVNLNILECKIQINFEKQINRNILGIKKERVILLFLLFYSGSF